MSLKIRSDIHIVLVFPKTKSVENCNFKNVVEYFADGQRCNIRESQYSSAISQLDIDDVTKRNIVKITNELLTNSIEYLSHKFDGFIFHSNGEEILHLKRIYTLENPKSGRTGVINLQSYELLQAEPKTRRCFIM